MIRGILFDLDGVLIETEWETFDFYRTYLATQGIYLKDSDFKHKAGRKSVDFWNSVLSPTQRKQIDTETLTSRKRKAFNRSPEKYIKKVSGGKEVLERLRAQHYLLALTTQNEEEMAATAMRWLDIGNLFDVVLTLQDISNKKPDPEIYLLAAKKLGIGQDECLVIEDSKDGVLSAKNAGMHCIAIRHKYTPREHLVPADAVIDDIKKITLEFIESIVKKKSGTTI